MAPSNYLDTNKKAKELNCRMLLLKAAVLLL